MKYKEEIDAEVIEILKRKKFGVMIINMMIITKKTNHRSNSSVQFCDL